MTVNKSIRKAIARADKKWRTGRPSGLRSLYLGRSWETNRHRVQLLAYPDHKKHPLVTVRVIDKECYPNPKTPFTAGSIIYHGTSMVQAFSLVLAFHEEAVLPGRLGERWATESARASIRRGAS